jgi:hypothetical protein
MDLVRQVSQYHLLRLARELGYELIRRGRPVSVALPVGEAVAAIGVPA